MGSRGPLELVPLGTRVASQLRHDVKVRAATEGRTVQDLVTQALREYLQNHEDPSAASR